MQHFKVILGFLLSIQLLCAHTINDDKGLAYFESEQYTKAFKYILMDAKKGDKTSQYRLGEMYEKGLGTKVDYKASMYWYKQAASHYALNAEPKKRIETKVSTSSPKVSDKELHIKDLSEDSFLSNFYAQFTKESFKSGNAFLLNKIDGNTSESQKMLSRFIGEDVFGLQAYKRNYFLPFSYVKDKPKYHNALINSSSPLFSTLTYDQNIEVEFQLSFKKQLTYNLFGLNEFIYAAYTQKVWWQLYSESAPFRETNYIPEVFLALPTSQEIDDKIGLKIVNFGFIHESNGQDGYRSRSWNRLYLAGFWKWDNLLLKARVWYRLPEKRKPDSYYNGTDVSIEQANAPGDDNPDILEYLGYGDIKLNYFWKENQFGLLLRNNFKFNGNNKGAFELDWAYSILNSSNTSLYIKVFHGYGESLISYDEKVTRASFGISFSPGLF